MGENPVKVMPSCFTALKKVRGNSNASRGRMIRAPPAYNVGNKVPNDPSKWNGDTHSPRVCPSMPKASAVAATAAAKAGVVTTTPFGVPVVPEV